MIERPRFQTKQELVYVALHDAIMACDLRPGQRLVIDEISRQLGVSHIPVREAIQQLQSEGLVQTVPHIGATVAPISRDNLREIFVLMEGFESVSMEIAAAQLTQEGFLRLDRLLADMDAAIADDAVQRWSQLNAAFHREIAAATAMPTLIDMLSRTLDHWDRIRRYFGIVSRRLPAAQAEHWRIVAALRAQDIEALRTLARDHSRNALGAYIAALDAKEASDAAALVATGYPGSHNGAGEEIA
ncbi:MAG TPA: GntR family transcriptional regulator [Thermomicrobiales bacterium]|nr:GntR family transcriptional regulator [Thermomicrobiales bacterium]